MEPMASPVTWKENVNATITLTGTNATVVKKISTISPAVKVHLSATNRPIIPMNFFVLLYHFI